MSGILSDRQRERITVASDRLDAWIEGEGFKGWDPYDALNSPLLNRLTSGKRRLGQVWVQLLKRSPINLRPALGVPKGYNPKGMGLFMASYWRKYLMTGRTEYLGRVQFFAEWLQTNVSRGYRGACWGYNFAWPNRGFFAPAGMPTIVNTAFTSLAFIDLVTLPWRGTSQGLEIAALQTARSACEFILNDLSITRPATDEICFSYTPLDHCRIHNANVMGACLLAQVSAQMSDPRLAEAALAAARFTSRRQRSDGAWRYGEEPGNDWVDSFHTGFVLVALKRISSALHTSEFEDTIARGYAYWKENFFTATGAPKYYPSRIYPLDIHSAAQAIITFLCLSELDPQAPELAKRMALWAIDNMQSPDGYFYFQVHRRYRIQIPYMRWSQAWMQRALTELAWSDTA